MRHQAFIAVRWALLVLAGTPAVVAASSRYVSPTGSDSINDCTLVSSPCMTIGAALEQASSGDVIKLAVGTYRESILIDVPGELTLEGGYSTDFANRNPSEFESVVDGEGTRVGVQVVAPPGGMLDVALDGLTVTGTTQCAIYSNGDVPGSIVLAVRQVMAERNACGMNAFDSILTVQDSVFRKNESTGLTLGDAVDATIDRTLFARNGYGGILASSGEGSILVRNSIFYGNASPAVGSQFPRTEPMNITIVNSTIAKTRVSQYLDYGGAIDLGSCPATLDLQNTIVWKTRGRTGSDIVTYACVDGPLEFNASHSNFSTLFPAYYNDLGGNLSANPRLRSGERARLHPDSPMIDAAECSLASSGDIDGDARPTGAGCDIGADEFVP